MLEAIKGWFFVLVTSLLLGITLDRFFGRIRRSARELRESEARSHLIGDNLPDSYVYQYFHGTDGKPRFTYLSAGVERIHGLKVGEILRDPNRLLDQIVPAQHASLTAAEAKSAQEMTDFAMELRIRLPDGVERNVHIRAKPRHDSDGLIYWDGFATDITERNRAEKELAQTRSTLLEAQKIAHLGSFEYIAATQTTIWSEEEYRIFGLDPDEPSPSYEQIFSKYIHPDDSALLQKRFIEAKQNRSGYELEYRIVQPNGSVRWVCDRARPYFDEQGEIVRYVGTTLDITDRKQADSEQQLAEENLRRSEQNYREIFHATNDAIFLHEAATGRVVDVNDAMLRMHGYDSKSDYFESQSNQVWSQDPHYNWEEAQRYFCLAVEKGPQVFEWIHCKKSGEPFWVEVSLRSSKIGGKDVVLSVVRDISQRKAQELEISRLSRLYATLSHVNQAIVRCQSRTELFNEMCQVLVEFGKFRGAWINERDDHAGKLRPSAHHGVALVLASSLGFGLCKVTSDCVESGSATICNDLSTDPRATCCREVMPQLGIQSCAAFSLRLHDRIIGAFSVCTSEPGYFQAEEIRLLEEIAFDISYALERLEEQTRRREAEAALQKSEEFRKAVLDSVTSNIAVLDRDGFIVAVNERWNEFARANPLGDGEPARNVEVGANYLDVCRRGQDNFAEGAGAAHDGIRAVLDGEQATFVLEYPCDSPSKKRWFSMVVSRLGSNREHVVVSHIDITERKLAEAALHDTNERLKKVLEVETVGVMFWELSSGVMIDANDSFLKLMGYTRREIEARELTWRKLTAPEFIELSRKEIGKLESTGRVGPYEKQCLRKDGAPQWLLFAGNKLESGTVVEFCIDISAQKNAEAALRESEKKHRSLYESSRDAIMTLDPATLKFTSGNPAALALFGVATPAELFSLGPADLSPERQPDGRLSSESAREIIGTAKERTGNSFEWKHRRINGEEFSADVLLTWIEWDGKPAIMSTIRDISVRKETEAKYLESEQRFRALVEAAPEAIFVRTGECFAYVNGATLKLFGASSPDQLLGHRVLDRFRFEYRPLVAGSIDQLDQLGESTHEADRLLLKLNGEEVEASISAVPISFEGRPSALVIARDISDRKRAEAALWQQFELQNQLSKVAATVPGTIYSFLLRKDGSMAMPYASAAMEGIFGLKPEQVRDDASPILALIHPDDAQRVIKSIITSAQTLKTWHEEFRGRGTRRGDIWVEAHSVPQLGPDGSVLWHGFIHDITERKKAEEELRKLSRAVEQSPVSIVITDAEGSIEYINPKFRELTGYTLEEIRGKNPRILKSSNKSPDEYRKLWQTIKAGETWRGEFFNRKKNGEGFWEFASISPVTDDAGNITHFLAVKEDITERRKLEEQFRQSQKLDAIGQLAGGVAHDFNNILAAMMMQAELSSLVEGIPDEVREGLEEIRAATDRAASLTRQLLLFSRKQVLQPRDLDLNEVVTSLAKMLQRIIREDVRLQLHLHPLPLITHGDAGMLDQVLMNLAVNARDAMPDGGHLLIETSEKTFDAAAARIHPDAAPGRYVGLNVMDTGVGMTSEVMARIFEPFFTTKEPGKGTGLGLATVFGIVKQHRGWITVQSEPGKGSQFMIYLPASESSPASDLTMARPPLQAGTETILLVEDDGSLRRMTRTLLERQGYTVIEAANGVDAVQIWQQHRDAVDLLLTDLVMPAGMTGQQLARELQASKPGLRVVFTSGYSAEIAGVEIHLRSGESFLQKPCLPALLLETIRKTLES